MLCVDKEGWDGGGGRKAQEGGTICILMPDSHCCSEKNIIIQSEVSQKEKHKYSILTHIYGI